MIDCSIVKVYIGGLVTKFYRRMTLRCPSRPSCYQAGEVKALRLAISTDPWGQQRIRNIFQLDMRGAFPVRIDLPRAPPILSPLVPCSCAPLVSIEKRDKSRVRISITQRFDKGHDDPDSKTHPYRRCGLEIASNYMRCAVACRLTGVHHSLSISATTSEQPVKKARGKFSTKS